MILGPPLRSRLTTEPTQLGVSNFVPDTLRAYLAICDQHGYVKPTVYQGDYSMINRGMEKHLLPLLREHGISFNAFRYVSAVPAGLLKSLNAHLAASQQVSSQAPSRQVQRRAQGSEAMDM
jgi:aryl-alcohol dehydrogenase-like predicted oxidoreductase